MKKEEDKKTKKETSKPKPKSKKETPKSKKETPIQPIKKEKKIVVIEKEKDNSNIWSYLKPIEKSKIIKTKISEIYFQKKKTQKTQIVLHNTETGNGVIEDIKNPNKIQTNIIIDRDGKPYHLFSSSYWGHHLSIISSFLYQQGFKDSSQRNEILNMSSISLEIDNWGRLEKLDVGRYRNSQGRIISIDDDKVTKYETPFNGYSYYESYTKEQLETIGELLLYWSNDYGIPLTYNGDDIFNINLNALKGIPGVWVSNSYVENKSNCHPDPKLIELLKSLS